MEFLTALWIGFIGLFGVAPQSETPIKPVAQEVAEVAVQPEATSEAQVTEGNEVDQTEVQTPANSESEVTIEAEVTAEADTDMSGSAPTVEQLSQATPPTPEPAVAGVDIQTAIVAGGCFWCVEADLEKTPGVIEVVSGYAGGSTQNPTYDNYGSGGHREVVEVTYDANQISFEDILIVTLKTTDPTDDDGTFGDRGDKYSSAFFYETDAERAIITNLIGEVDANGPYAQPLAIDIEPRPQFWVAEDRHQDYYKGTLTQVKYQFYRERSGRTDFIKQHWGEDTSPNLPWRNANNTTSMNNDNTTYAWANYVKPDIATLRATLDPLAFKVTQEDGTERAGTSPLDKVWDRGIYVDILSGEPLYSSRDKFDSGTGWPSFVAPITSDALTLHEDRKLFSVRTETRSAIADNHIGHVFNDGPADRGGLRYCMNGAALRFVPEADMAAEGYADFIQYL